MLVSLHLFFMNCSEVEVLTKNEVFESILEKQYGGGSHSNTKRAIDNITNFSGRKTFRR